ncbi:hypothetical protein [Ancylobacter terrae]|uniref:hypothetical protein n=1 Tax=Ancylobacter sp. sgz301288 TaxID=3342077 RepID=UPI00385E99FB
MRRVLVGAIAAGWLVTTIQLAGAQPILEQLSVPRGYVALDYPRDFGGNPLVGMLVQISRSKGFRPLGHLSDCGLPASALKPLPGVIGLLGLSRQKARVSGSAAATFLGLLGLELKGEANRQIEITIEGATEEALVPIAVVGAARSNAALLKERCGDILKLPNVFWINSAIRVDRLRLRLLDASGAALAASAQQLGPYVSGVEGKVDISLAADGDLDIRRTVYVAFRDAPPSELLLGAIQLHSTEFAQPDKDVEFGDEIYTKP